MQSDALFSITCHDRRSGRSFAIPLRRGTKTSPPPFAPRAATPTRGFFCPKKALIAFARARAGGRHRRDENGARHRAGRLSPPEDRARDHLSERGVLLARGDPRPNSSTGERRKPAVAAFGVAGPVVGGRAHITKLPWSPEERSIARAAGIPRVRLLNDFVAAAFGLAVPLRPPARHRLPGQARPRRPDRHPRRRDGPRAGRALARRGPRRGGALGGRARGFRAPQRPRRPAGPVRPRAVRPGRPGSAALRKRARADLRIPEGRGRGAGVARGGGGHRGKKIRPR